MKQLLLFATTLAAGYLLGNSRKRGTTSDITFAIKADTSQALAALEQLQAKAQQVEVVVGAIGADGFGERITVGGNSASH